ncbi:metal ABC transporter permease [Buchnera aphidicola]|uniref:High-affinity zinc uptake system membrane protein ZnuB n=1 Tax=Buchnera aphidicola (Sarucallis kahawaluokalani) TaxID=1241878 RepID=A0A4D6YA07_9GAMM|nr:metal ABC transporter permease [Buchnera aphidicola]QCI26012.1 zinc ABC transporter permease [Buchnera aphidicola (Sarucallis kahawaluokalani)]
MYKNYFLIWIAGLLLSVCCGPLGAFILWRKISSFGNTLSHASLLGLSIALLLKINVLLAVLTTLFFLTVVIIYIEHISSLNLDTILAIVTYSSLSLGMIILHIISKNEQADLTKYLLGNLLELKFIDINIIFFITLIISSVVIILWKSILLMIINAELACVDGINVFNVRLILMLLITLLIGISTTLIGALLITAILIIPAAIAQRFSTSPELMVLFSIIINIIAITIGIFINIFYNIPISPVIILLESIFFIISLIM